MKIAIIRPSMFGRPAKDAMQPLLFAILKGITPPDWEISFFDELVEAIPEDLQSDAVVITVDTFSARRAYRLAARYKRQGSKVILGGFHPTMMPEECLQHADAVVIGEAEDTWGAILEDLKTGDLKERYLSRNDTDLSKVVYDYSVFGGKPYNRLGLVQFGRGCKFRCDFCSIHAFYGDTVRCRKTADIVEEIKGMKQKYLFFIDDNIFADEAKARELFTALIPLGKKWFCQISIDAAGDKEMLKLMKRAGCVLLLIGFESLDRDNLKLMKKSANLCNSDYEAVIENIYDCGLMIYGTFVFGYPFDTVAGVQKTVKFALDHHFAIANFNPLMPMPGTALYDRLKAEGRLIHDKWWIDPSYCYGDAMLQPGAMTGEQLKAACKSARFEFNSYKNIFQRLFFGGSPNRASLENVVIYLLANFISRGEIMAKQGQKLGGGS